MTLARSESFPAASYAATPRMYITPQVKFVNVKVVPVTGLTGAPFRYTLYPATPTLSLDGVHAIPIADEVTDATLTVGVVGGLRSVLRRFGSVREASVLPKRRTDDERRRLTGAAPRFNAGESAAASMAVSHAGESNAPGSVEMTSSGRCHEVDATNAEAVWGLET